MKFWKILPPLKRNRKWLRKLSSVLIGREKRMLSLVKEYFTLEDLVEIKERLDWNRIYRRQIGGNAAGTKHSAEGYIFDWSYHLELHDSFYIGSDVFYSYIVQNGWWKLLMTQKTEEGYFEVY